MWPTVQYESPSKICDVIRTALKTEGDAYTRLSNVGLELSRVFRRPFRELSSERSLMVFLKKYMADEIEFYSEPARPLVWFVRLKSVSTGLQTPVALGNGTPGTRGAVQASVHTEEAPLYETAFWAAFAKPLPEEGAQRYLKITYPFRFDHFRPDATIPDGYVRVDDRYIAPEGLMHGDSRTKFILTQISAWLQDNDLSPESFLRRQKPYVENSRGSQIIQILSSLEPDDLRRISIPADIWIRLLKS